MMLTMILIHRDGIITNKHQACSSSLNHYKFVHAWMLMKRIIIVNIRASVVQFDVGKRYISAGNESFVFGQILNTAAEVVTSTVGTSPQVTAAAIAT